MISSPLRRPGCGRFLTPQPVGLMHAEKPGIAQADLRPDNLLDLRDRLASF